MINNNNRYQLLKSSESRFKLKRECCDWPVSKLLSNRVAECEHWWIHNHWCFSLV